MIRTDNFIHSHLLQDSPKGCVQTPFNKITLATTICGEGILKFIKVLTYIPVSIFKFIYLVRNIIRYP